MGKLASQKTLERQKVFDALKRMKDTGEAVYVNLHGSRLKVRPYTDNDDPSWGMNILFYLRPSTRLHFGETLPDGRWPLRLHYAEPYIDGSQRPGRSIPDENILGVVLEVHDR